MGGEIPGIHHVTAICSDAQGNIDFYCNLLGLRLVKLTVNFDDPGAYHLYYGDELGRPGSVLTFFAWPGARQGRNGTGQVNVTAFSVPAEALSFWQQRLQERGHRNRADNALRRKGARFPRPRRNATGTGSFSV
jgi:glyoxalase family protein